MTGKILAALILVCALVAGAAMYYLQVYAFYEEVPASGLGDVALTPRDGGAPQPVAVTDFRAIDAESSPIRYRACFAIDTSLDALARDFEPYEGAAPRVAPGWFDCFDADALGAEIDAGRAIVLTGERNLEYGIDRVVAVTAEGRGYVWHEVNECGDKSYDGSPLGEDCPEPPAN
ncbi:DUF6446 family protein [Roseivivax isoporae]|uniref:Signal transduction histidine kinase n=1 Tax=Roseivivax isoporae LMG 25204 TaxID=1449351 RepID=X7FA13_9RHOB|nr:DUF6446 family protein [Roseivivax isoporae]ETX29757.1 signal transduction histidine kinase [Roseivivax isoporae LMG 25204]